MKVIHVAAPFIPFMTEEIYQNLRTSALPVSIHLADYPTADGSVRDLDLEKKMEITRKAVSMGRALRSVHSLKIRQPLKAIYLVTRDTEERRILREMEDIIREELNVKEVLFKDNEEDLVVYKAKANFKVLGKKLGKEMKTAAKKIETLSMDEIQSILEGSVLHLDFENKSVDLTEESIIVQRFEKENMKVLNEGSLTVALDSEITEDLFKEGIVRDVIRSIQKLRKDRGLEVTDRILLYIDGSGRLKDAVKNFEEHLLKEILGESIIWTKKNSSMEVDCGTDVCFIDLEKK